VQLIQHGVDLQLLRCHRLCDTVPTTTVGCAREATACPIRIPPFCTPADQGLTQCSLFFLLFLLTHADAFIINKLTEELKTAACVLDFS